MRTFEVGEDAGMRLDAFVALHAGSRTAAQRAIEAGLITIGGVGRQKRYVVKPGDTVVWADAPSGPQDAGVRTTDFSIVYEDDDLLVIEKGAGVIVHPGAGHTTGTLVQALAGKVGGGDDPRRAGVVHRLDRDTSGLLIFARNETAHAELSNMIRRRVIQRHYTTLVEGELSARSGQIDAPLGRDRQSRTKMSIDTDNPRDAQTLFEVAETLVDSTLVHARLATGRTHQIRVHFQAIGHPVVGDPTYGGKLKYGLKRQFLHAHRLVFAHPVTGVELDLRSELPGDLTDALKRAQQR